MKTTLTFSIALLLLIGFAIPFNVYAAESFTYKNSLVKKTSTTYTPTAPTLPGADACATPATPTPVTPMTYDAYTVMQTPGDFTVVSFKIFYTDNIGGTILNSYLSLSPATVNFNTTSGEITYTMTGIAQTRKSLSVVVYLNDGSGTGFDTTEFYTSQANTDPPIGTIIPYYGSAASVAALNLGGWFLCDGTSINSISDDILFPDEKAALISVVGANFPDLRGLFLRGAGTNSYDPASPRSIGSVQTEQTGFTAHNYDKVNSPTGSTDVGVNFATVQSGTGASVVGSLSSANHNHSISHTATATIDPSPGTKETRPDNVAVTYIIKARR